MFHGAREYQIAPSTANRTVRVASRSSRTKAYPTQGRADRGAVAEAALAGRLDLERLRRLEPEAASPSSKSSPESVRSARP